MDWISHYNIIYLFTINIVVFRLYKKIKALKHQSQFWHLTQKSELTKYNNKGNTGTWNKQEVEEIKINLKRFQSTNSS